jgi:hypothetical protein
MMTLAAYTGCGHKAAVNDPQLQKVGAVEVIARLVEIPEPFPANDVYNYGYVFRSLLSKTGQTCSVIC